MQSYLSRSAFAFALAACALLASNAPSPAQSTTSAPAANTTALSDPDFCSVFLSPELQQDLGLSQDQVKQMGDLKFKLQMMLDNVTKHMPVEQQSALSLARVADTCLTNCGKETKDDLTPAQIEKLNGFVKDGTLKPLKVETASARTGRSPVRGMTYSKIDIVYHYKDGAAAAGPTKTAGITTPGGEASAHSETPVPVTGGPASPPAVARPTPPARGPRGRGPALEPVKDFSEAMKLLSDKTNPRAPAAADFLTAATVDDKQRSQVEGALKPFLDVGDGGEHLPYVKAFVHWANADAVPDLVGLMEQHKGGLPNGYDQVWSATIPTLMELDMKSAEKVVLERKGELFFRNAVTGALKPIAFGDGPTKQHAEHLLVVMLVQ